MISRVSCRVVRCCTGQLEHVCLSVCMFHRTSWKPKHCMRHKDDKKFDPFSPWI